MAQKAVSKQVDTDGNEAKGWLALTTNDTGAPLVYGARKDRTIHIFGDWGSGASFSLYGSNDKDDLAKDPGAVGANWVILADPNGNAITKTANAIETILDCPLYLACKLTSGTTPSVSALIAA